MKKKEYQDGIRRNKKRAENFKKWSFCAAPPPARTGYQKSGSKGAKSAGKGK